MWSPACRRSCSPSLSRMCPTCFFTVGSLIASAVEISLLESPSASSAATSSSRSESPRSNGASAGEPLPLAAKFAVVWVSYQDCPAAAARMARNRSSGSASRRTVARAPWAAASARQSVPTAQRTTAFGVARWRLGGFRTTQLTAPRSESATILTSGSFRSSIGTTASSFWSGRFMVITSTSGVSVLHCCRASSTLAASPTTAKPCSCSISQTRPPRSIACGSPTTTRMSSLFFRAPSREGVFTSFGLRVDIARSSQKPVLYPPSAYCYRTGPARLRHWYESMPPLPPSGPFRSPLGGAMNWLALGGGASNEDPDRRGPVPALGAGGPVRDPDAVAGGQPGDRGERDDPAALASRCGRRCRRVADGGGERGADGGSPDPRDRGGSPAARRGHGHGDADPHRGPARGAAPAGRGRADRPDRARLPRPHRARQAAAGKCVEPRRDARALQCAGGEGGST